MRFAPLFAGLAAVAAAAPLAEEAAPQDIANVHSVLSPAEMAAPAEAQEVAAEQAPEPDMSSTANGVKILAKFKDTAAKDGAKRTTVKYGTWTVTSKKMMQSTKLAQGPCMTGCLVTGMEATIRYPDGKEANADTGAWMHHIAMFGTGAGGGSLWAAGNERPTLRLNDGGSKYGLDFPKAFMLMVDLMTEVTTPKTLTLEITYEHVPKSTSGYKAAAMYWLTIGEPAAKDGVYKFTSMPSISGYNAKLLYAIGHMHDGGTDMRLFVNGQLTCKSYMHYSGGKEGGGHSHGGEAMKSSAPAASETTKKTSLMKGKAGKASKEEAPAEEETSTKSSKSAKSGGMSGHSHGRRDGHGGHGGGDMDMPHIVAPGACTNFGTVSKGARLTSEAWYDTKKHPLMVHNGKKENLMGNMRVYIGPN